MSTAEIPESSSEPDQPGGGRGGSGGASAVRSPHHAGAGAGAHDDASSPTAPDALFTPPFVRLLGMQAAYGFSFSMFFLLPKYLVANGATPSQIGFVMGGFGVACVLTIPVLQPALRLLGRRGALMAATTCLAAAGFAFAVIAPVGLGAVFLRASEGVTWTIMFSTGLLLTAEMAPAHRLAQAIGLAGAAALVMNAVAPAIGEPIADRFGYRPVFAVAAVAALVAAGMARRLPRSPGPAARPSATAPAGAVAGDSRGRRLRIYLVFGFSGLAFSSLFTFLAPYALGQGVHAIRAFFIGYTSTALAVRVLGGRLADRLGHRSIATFALVLYGLVVASTGILGPHHLAVLGALFGLAHGAVFPAMMALLISHTPAERRPAVFGIANGAMSVGVSAVFPAGLVVARFGYPTMFALAGGLVTISATLIRSGRVRVRAPVLRR